MDASLLLNRLLPARVTSAQLMVSSVLLTALLTGCGERKPTEPVASDPTVPLMEDVSENTSSAAPRQTNPQQNLAVSYQVNNVTGEVPQRLEDLFIDPAILASAPQVWVQADFQVADVLKSSRAIASAAQNLNGYVASHSISNVRNDMRSADKDAQNIALISYQREASMTVRVPKAQTKAFLEQVQKQVLLLNAQAFGIEDRPSNQPLLEDTETASEGSAARETAPSNTTDSANAADNASEGSAPASIDVRAANGSYSDIELTFRQMAGVYRESSRNISGLMDAEIPEGKY